MEEGALHEVDDVLQIGYDEEGHIGCGGCVVLSEDVRIGDVGMCVGVGGDKDVDGSGISIYL